MPFLRPLEYAHSHTHRWPVVARYGCALGLIGASFGLRLAVGDLIGEGAVPFMFFFPAILASSALFSNGAGFVSTAFGAALSGYYIQASGPFGFHTSYGLVSLTTFLAAGWLTACTVETLHNAVRRQRAALLETQAAERRRALLLIEYRHRSRGDLQSISSLLRLRARYIAEPNAQRALQEAAGHAVALGRIHARLEHARHDRHEVAVVDSRCFMHGLCADLVPPVIEVFAMSRPLSTERSVALGLLLHELVGDARRDAATAVAVRLTAMGPDFLLDVIDNRAARGEQDGLRERMTGLLAGQLRGRLARVANVAGPGWSVSVTFPILAPVLAPGAVGQ